jgi:hypothetical protein
MLTLILGLLFTGLWGLVSVQLIRTENKQFIRSTRELTCGQDPTLVLRKLTYLGRQYEHGRLAEQAYLALADGLLDEWLKLRQSETIREPRESGTLMKPAHT